jgi:hypothetical protein
MRIVLPFVLVFILIIPLSRQNSLEASSEEEGQCNMPLSDRDYLRDAPRWRMGEPRPDYVQGPRREYERAMGYIPHHLDSTSA